MSARVALAVRIAVSVALVALVLWWVDLGELRATLANLTVAGLLPVVALHTGDRLLMAYKWQRLLAAGGPSVPLGAAIRAYYVSSFAGVFLPMTVGADLVRVAALRRSPVGAGRLVASIAIERLLGAVSQALFCVLAIALAIGLQLRADMPLGWLALALVLGAAVATAALPLSFRLADREGARLAGRTGLAGKVGSLGREYARWRGERAAIRRFFLLTLLEGLFPIATYLAAARALGVPADPVALTAVVPLVYLLARLPVSYGGFGGEQAGFAGIAAALGVMAKSEALAVSVLVSPVALLVALLPGAVLWYLRRGRPVDAA